MICSSLQRSNDISREAGMDISTAINVFLKQVIRSNGIPFPISADIPNAATIKAIKDAKKGEMASFSSIDELMENLTEGARRALMTSKVQEYPIREAFRRFYPAFLVGHPGPGFRNLICQDCIFNTFPYVRVPTTSTTEKYHSSSSSTHAVLIGWSSNN